MPLKYSLVMTLRRAATALVVRPRAARCRNGTGSEPQTLLFLGGEARELQQITDDVGRRTFSLGAGRVGGMRKARCAVYEPTTDSLFYVEADSAIMQLESSGMMILVAGSETEQGCLDARGEAARFGVIRALAADGRGVIYVAEDACIRALTVSTGEVRTLAGSVPQSGSWRALSYDPAADTVLAASDTGLCRVSPNGYSPGGSAPAATPHLVAGDWRERGTADGSGTAARFHSIASIVAVTADGRGGGALFVADGHLLRSIDMEGNVATECKVGAAGSLMGQLAVLPTGQLAVCFQFDGQDGLAGVAAFSRAVFKPGSEVLGGWLRSHDAATVGLHHHLRAVFAAHDGGGSDGADAAMVTVSVGAEQVPFMAHRSVLAAHSEYFKTLLAPGSGFADGGTSASLLDDVDPDAFGCLVSYMYTGELHVPNELLRPAAALAAQMLLAPACTGVLVARLKERVTPGSVVEDLCWAERHNMAELVAHFRAYLLWHRKEVAEHDGLGDLITQFPGLAEDLMRALLLTGW